MSKKIKIFRKTPEVRWSGSLIQQNHGEENSKGFLIWDIQDKTTFTVKHISIPNPNPFISIVLEPDGSLNPNIDIPIGARLRVISETNLPIDTIRKSIDVVKTKFNPDSVTFLNKADNKNSFVSIDGILKKEDLRNVNVQEKLIREYLKDYHIDECLYEKLFDINKKLNLLAESKQSSIRNVDYQVLNFEWDNLFNYGSGNKIDFNHLSGTIGVFGKNFSGKSSIVDSFLYTLFNSITKNSRKKTKIINKDCNAGSGRATLRSGNKKFLIKRDSEKYVKKLHGSETIEAKTYLDFSVEDMKTGEIESLNGIDRIETDKNITKYFGSFDDFLLTSMSSQLGALTYIDKGSTERKEILAKFLDVDFFSEKFELANKESADIKSVIKKLEGKNFDNEISQAEIQLVQNKNSIAECEIACSDLGNKISIFDKEIIVLTQIIESSPDELIDIDVVRSSLKKKNDESQNIKNSILEIENKIVESESKLKRVDEFIENFDIQSLKDKQEIISNHESALELLLKEIDNSQKDMDHDLKKVSILKEVPCGSEYSHCKFIRGAYEAKEQINIIKILIEKKQQEKNDVQDKIKKLDTAKVEEQISKYNLLLEKKIMFVREIKNLKPQVEIKLQLLKVVEMEIFNLLAREQKYKENKEKIDKIESLLNERKSKEKDLKDYKSNFVSCENKLKDMYKNAGFIEQKIEKLSQEKEELNKMRSDYEAYDLFMKCMHPSGISYDIIKKSLPNINDEISKILSNIVEFQVYFENEDNRLEIYMKKPNDNEPLPIEMGSGAQKCIASMAIRLAFINISSLPKSDIFILDEPGTSLDEDNMAGFIRMLDVIKSQFKCVILISHLDVLKDSVDSIISIDNKDGFASVVF